MDLIHRLSLGDVLSEHGRSLPVATATVDGGERCSYQKLDRRVDQLANALADRGVGRGDRIVWLAQNSARVLELLLAAARLGAIMCPANWRQSGREMAWMVEDADPSVVFWQERELGEAIADCRSAHPDRLWIEHIAAGENDEYERLVASGEPTAVERVVDPDDPFVMLYTAAFDGKPAGALLSQWASICQSCVLALLHRLDSDYVYLNSGPLFHVGTLMITMATFQFGGTNVFIPRVDARQICELIENERCRGAFLTQPTIEEIVELNAAGRYDLSSLEVRERDPRWLSMVTPSQTPYGRWPSGYGQTEAMGLMTFRAFGRDEAAGSFGRPSPWLQIRIVDEDGVGVPTGEVGEIVARGPTVMMGFWNRPEMTAQRQRGGWHRTGDLGYRAPDGSIEFVGPMGRMIKSGAENIYPSEVERCLCDHPSVAAAAVIGVPDPVWAQSVKAIVVVREDAVTSEQELIDHCRRSIASYKKPRSVEFVDALPRDRGGVDYAALDERFGGGNYPGAGA